MGKIGFAVSCSLAAMSFLQSAQSAEIKSGVGKSGQAAIWITGELVPGDSDKFSSAVKQANDAGKYVANVRLDSPGGNLLEGAKIADSIRFGKMATNVGRTAVCASACFLMFAAGSAKNVSYGARIGVHGASNENGEETAASGAIVEPTRYFQHPLLNSRAADEIYKRTSRSTTLVSLDLRQN